MANKALVTITIGDESEKLAELTHPLLKAYADRLKVDFIVIKDRTYTTSEPTSYEKFQLYKMLHEYRAVLYVDTDVIIRPDCIDMFGFLNRRIGFWGFDELEFIRARKHDIEIGNEKLFHNQTFKMNWYYNTGVMVVPREAKAIFSVPNLNDFSLEQTYLNLQIANFGVLHKGFGCVWNRMACMDEFLRQHRLNAQIVNYRGSMGISGWGKLLEPQETAFSLISRDIKEWKVMGYE